MAPRHDEHRAPGGIVCINRCRNCSTHVHNRSGGAQLAIDRRHHQHRNGDGDEEPDPEQRRTKQVEHEESDEGRRQSTGCASGQVRALLEASEHTAFARGVLEAEEGIARGEQDTGDDQEHQAGQDHRQVEQLADQEARGQVEVIERIRERRIPTVVEREANPQQANLYAGETEQESDVRKRPREDPQALSREHNNFEHDPGAQHCEQDAGEQAPASSVSGPREVDRFADGDLIPPRRHEKSKAICSVDRS
jgi:hypothetical protein